MNAIAFRSSLNQFLIDARRHPGFDDDGEDHEVFSDSVPSPDEIRRRCEEIQKEWSPRERMKRAGVPIHQQRGWTPPIVSVCEMEL